MTLSVAATSGSTIDYQWRRNTIDIPGANDPTYTIEALSPETAGVYMCEVTNPCGEMPSNPATVSICYANCDLSDGIPALTANDFQCFLDRFTAGTVYANCDGSSASPALTANDFQCFINSYATGCP